MKRPILFHLFLLFYAATSVAGNPVTLIRANCQHHFGDRIPAGNYSGISRLNDSLYAVVSDKSSKEGFFLFQIRTDSLTGDILDVQNRGFRGQELSDRDEEGIAYIPALQTVLISGEKDRSIVEYDMDGKRTGREAAVPDLFRKASADYGMESLTYNDSTRTLWTCTERPLPADSMSRQAADDATACIRICSFGTSLQPIKQYAYRMDRPEARPEEGGYYAMGVSELAALDDGTLLVLEREFFVPAAKLGASVRCKIYQVNPDSAVCITGNEPLRSDVPVMDKRIVTQWETRLTLFNHALANYEGMCLGPQLADGSRVIILVSDSQNQYAGVLKDWFRTLVIR